RSDEDPQEGGRQREASSGGEVPPGGRRDLPGAGRGESAAAAVAGDPLAHLVRLTARLREADAPEAGQRGSGRGQQPRGRREEEGRHAQDGRGQQGLRALPLVRETNRPWRDRILWNAPDASA